MGETLSETIPNFNITFFTNNAYSGGKRKRTQTTRYCQPHPNTYRNDVLSSVLSHLLRHYFYPLARVLFPLE